jgi:agmatinase
MEQEQQLTSEQADSVFSGISTFGRLPYSPCLATHAKYDIAFIGREPYDMMDFGV